MGLLSEEVDLAGDQEPDRHPRMRRLPAKELGRLALRAVASEVFYTRDDAQCGHGSGRGLAAVAAGEPALERHEPPQHGGAERMVKPAPGEA